MRCVLAAPRRGRRWALRRNTPTAAGAAAAAAWRGAVRTLAPRTLHAATEPWLVLDLLCPAPLNFKIKHTNPNAGAAVLNIIRRRLNSHPIGRPDQQYYDRNLRHCSSSAWQGRAYEAGLKVEGTKRTRYGAPHFQAPTTRYRGSFCCCCCYRCCCCRRSWWLTRV